MKHIQQMRRAGALVLFLLLAVTHDALAYRLVATASAGGPAGYCCPVFEYPGGTDQTITTTELVASAKSYSSGFVTGVPDAPPGSEVGFSAASEALATPGAVGGSASLSGAVGGFHALWDQDSLVFTFGTDWVGGTFTFGIGADLWASATGNLSASATACLHVRNGCELLGKVDQTPTGPVASVIDTAMVSLGFIPAGAGLRTIPIEARAYGVASLLPGEYGLVEAGLTNIRLTLPQGVDAALASGVDALSVTVVPLPGTALLFASGLLGLLARNLRRRA